MPLKRNAVGSLIALVGTALLLTGCAAADAAPPSYKSDDGSLEISVTQIAKLKSPGNGQVCAVGYSLTNRSVGPIDVAQIYVNPSASPPIDFTELVDVEIADDFSMTLEGWRLGFWGEAQGIGDDDTIDTDETAKVGDVFPCSDLGGSFELGVDGEEPARTVKITIPEW